MKAIINFFKNLFGKSELPDTVEREPVPPTGTLPPPAPAPLPSNDKWSHLDPNHVVPIKSLEKALKFYDDNREKFKNNGYLTICDFRQHSGKKRMYIIGLQSGKVEQHAVAHGQGSDPDNDGYANKFSNTNGSHQSSLGMCATGGTFSNDNHGYCMLLNGLEDTNDQIRKREIIVHPANYVRDGASKQGRSWGCPAVDPTYSKSIIDKIKGGSPFYIDA